MTCEMPLGFRWLESTISRLRWCQGGSLFQFTGWSPGLTKIRRSGGFVNDSRDEKQEDWWWKEIKVDGWITTFCMCQRHGSSGPARIWYRRRSQAGQIEPLLILTTNRKSIWSIPDATTRSLSSCFRLPNWLRHSHSAVPLVTLILSWQRHQ